MKTYAGIGSRDITIDERRTIMQIAKRLKDDFTVLTGNADGTDSAFRDGSEGNCVLILPWKNFNKANLQNQKVKEIFALGSGAEGVAAINQFHPAPERLTHGARQCIARNYYQIAGYDKYPEVSFVVCCAKSDGKGGVWGGTGQAVRIAQERNIPIFNIREEGWKEALNTLLQTL